MDTVVSKLAALGISELWVAKVLAALLVTAILHASISYILIRLLRVTKKTDSPLDDALISSALKTVPTLIWILGLSIALIVMGKHFENELFNIVPVVRDAGITICFAWFGWLFIDDGSRRYLAQQRVHERDEIDRTTIDALSKLGHLLIIIAAVLTLMQILGFSVSGLLAAGGIGGIAIGFAAKDLLANFFGGFTIYTDRPFVVGDWIRSPDKDIEGVVEKISWRYTQIRRFNKNPVYVPNSVFTVIAVENPSRMSNRRIKETIGIRYDDIGVMSTIVTDVKAMLQSHPGIDTSKTLIVNFNAFNASSVDFFIYTFARTVVWEEFHAVKQDVLLKIADIVAENGAEIAFPTQTIHIAENAQLPS